MPIAGFPSLLATDANAFQYGPKGEMAPESALREQALNRRRQIANLLIQRGLAGSPGGKMVGRFYVADSPLQHLSSMGQALVGVLGNKALDKEQKDIAESDRQLVLDAIQDYREKLRQPAQGQAAPSQGQPIPPAPGGPYQGEIGAVPMPEAGVQSEKPPIPTQPMPSQAGVEAMHGLDMQRVVPADMSQAAQPIPHTSLPSPEPEQAQPIPPAGARKPSMDDLVGLLTHQHPQVRAFGQLQAAMLQKQQEREAQQEFLAGEKELDREVRRDALLENSMMRQEQMKQNMILTQMQIDARTQQGLDANELKRSLADQANELQKLQMANASEMKKAELRSRADIAKQHDETLKTIAGMNIEGRKDVAGMKAGVKDGIGKSLPGSIGQKFIDNSSNLRMAENALALISGQSVGGAKGDKNATGIKSYLPDALLQRVDPSGVDTRAAIANLGSMVIHDRSGAAVTAAEFPRLRPFIPSANDAPEVVRKKLSQFVNEYRKVIDEMTDFYEEAGYNVPKDFHRGLSDQAGQPTVRKYNPATGKIE
jgi:hypothetical protein